MNEDPLTQLIRRSKAGDREARDELFELLTDEERFGRTLYSFVRQRFPKNHPGRRNVDTQDVVQSAIRSGIRKMDGLRGSSAGELYAWLRWILRGKLRKHTHRSHHSLDPATETPDPVDDTPEAKALHNELRQELFAAVSELDLAKRLVILCYLDGHDTNHVARTLELRPETVRKRRSRAIQEIRTTLQARGYLDGLDDADPADRPWDANRDDDER